MMWSEFYEQEVRPRLTVDRIYTDVAFTKKGEHHWKGPCPKHNGVDSNFRVSTEHFGWACFSHCGTGSVFNYLDNWGSARGQGYVEAVKHLAALAGIAIPEELAGPGAVRTPVESLLEAFVSLSKAALLSPEAASARAYLATRGFAAIDEKVQLGYSPEAESVRQQLTALGFTSADINSSKLLANPRWVGRIVIPWRDYSGHIATLVAREVDKPNRSSAAAKYLYLANRTKPAAFGLFEALMSRGGREDLLLVEGLLDVVLFQSRGFRAVAALGGSGSLLNKDRWEELAQRGVKRFTLALDNDAAGVEGTLKAIETSLDVEPAPPDLWVLPPSSLGDCKDPDAYVRQHGLPAFEKLLNSKETAAVFYARQILSGVGEGACPLDKRKALDRVLAFASRLEGPHSALHREDVIHLASQKTGYSEKALRVELSSLTGPVVVPDPGAVIHNQAKAPPAEPEPIIVEAPDFDPEEVDLATTNMDLIVADGAADTAKTNPALDRAARIELGVVIDLKDAPARFAASGWFSVGETVAPCPKCGTVLHGFRRPYVSSGRTYHYWALVCDQCLEALEPAQLRDDIRKSVYKSSNLRPDARPVVGAEDSDETDAAADPLDEALIAAVASYKPGELTCTDVVRLLKGLSTSARARKLAFFSHGQFASFQHLSRKAIRAAIMELLANDRLSWAVGSGSRLRVP